MQLGFQQLSIDYKCQYHQNYQRTPHQQYACEAEAVGDILAHHYADNQHSGRN